MQCKHQEISVGWQKQTVVQLIQDGADAQAHGANGLGKLARNKVNPKSAHRDIVRALGWPKGALYAKAGRASTDVSQLDKGALPQTCMSLMEKACVRWVAQSSDSGLAEMVLCNCCV